MNDTSAPSWQSTIIATVLISLVGAIFLVVFYKSGIDDALKAWAALGTIVGVLTGAVPTYFFGQSAIASARREAQREQAARQDEQNRRVNAEERLQTLLAHVPAQSMVDARAARPDLF